MEFINTWWAGLEPLTRWFFGVAIFFSIFFLWQLIMSFVGLTGGDGALDSHVGSTDVHNSPSDADASVAAFKLLSFRSILAFFTLFFWSGSLSLQNHAPLAKALGLAMVWGLAAMFLVALLLYLMKRMTETGNLRYSTCVGAEATVYLDIPAGGVGEVRMLCSGVMTHMKARAAADVAFKAGKAVRVVKLLGLDMVEVTDTNSPVTSEGKAVAS
jgi:hypothetical protein